MKRRSVLAGAAALGAARLGAPATLAAAAWLTGCDPGGRMPLSDLGYDGGWVGADHTRGHLLRDGPPGGAAAAPSTRRAAVLIVGAGIAGLACARALRQRGIDDVHLLELEDHSGGNSRSHQLGGMACPLGAHYLPVPDDHNEDLVALLAEFGLCTLQQGRWVYDERHLCHSPQERLFIQGADDHGASWHEGLLPPVEALPPAERTAAHADYRRFAELVGEQVGSGHFAMPTAGARWNDVLSQLDRQTFAAWLDQQGLHAAALRWYLDYCCRDDYGGGTAQVSAWAGLHYFASRHGFHAPGDGAADEGGILTWPEGNAWLGRRLAAPLGERLHAGRTVLKVDEGRHEVTVDAWDNAARRSERWTARRVVMCTPLFISQRLLSQPTAALQAASAALRYAPWLVGNLQTTEALSDHPGAPPSWDNVLYGSAALGYVDAMHQNTLPYQGATVLTTYWALGGNTADEARAQRRALLDTPWRTWAERVVNEMAPAHPDLRYKLKRVDLMRYGHAMSMPVPGVRSSAALQALAHTAGRVSFAHADLSGYSIFEEAFFHGHRVGTHLVI